MPGVAVVVVVVVAAAAAAAAVWRHDVNDMSTREKRSRGSWEGGAGDTQTHTRTRTAHARTTHTHRRLLLIARSRWHTGCAGARDADLRWLGE